jgi:hypothetical protein
LLATGGPHSGTALDAARQAPPALDLRAAAHGAQSIARRTWTRGSLFRLTIAKKEKARQ